MRSNLAELMADLKEQQALALVEAQLAAGGDPHEILAACQAGMIRVGQKFEQGAFYVSDLLMAAEMFKTINEILAPRLAGTAVAQGAKIVVGTVAGDIHDIGKDLVVAMLQAGGFEVHDLGVDAPPGVFVARLRETGAKVLALSCLLTTAYDSIKDTIAALEEAGLRTRVKVIIGGGPMDELVVAYTGADAYGADAQAAVRLSREMIG
ncbi:MAG: cobalamin-dependent protein [Deltaproteobacteria bacterium]|nr:cobalamin-dependent protein [Deltaproteobacteria bacterium]